MPLLLAFRASLVFNFDLLNILAFVSWYQACCSISSFNALWGCYDEICQSVELVTSVDFVTVGFIEMFGDITGAC